MKNITLINNFIVDDVLCNTDVNVVDIDDVNEEIRKFPVIDDVVK